ncbi:Na(+)/H(+) antiporter NhaA [Acrasis kona]|uniref:Na(+)/H(+) antiporter NhaA n=1 Tax=Acrasis kona TaxID=1008807 RepID=A0AAW2ZJV1_9EUKA
MNIQNTEQKQVATGTYTDDMMQLLSFMMKTPCITPQASGSAESSRKAAPNPPLAPMHDLTSTIANLQVYNTDSNSEVVASLKNSPLAHCSIVIENTSPNKAGAQNALKPKPIPLLKRDYKSMLLSSLSPNIDAEFCLSPSLTFLSPRLSPVDGINICPDKKKIRAARSPIYDSHDLFAVLVDICDGQNAQDQLFNMGNN